jgi:hypothetical protein
MSYVPKQVFSMWEAGYKKIIPVIKKHIAICIANPLQFKTFSVYFYITYIAASKYCTLQYYVTVLYPIITA